MRTISAREAASAGLAAAAMVAELVMWASFHPKTLGTLVQTQLVG